MLLKYYSKLGNQKAISYDLIFYYFGSVSHDYDLLSPYKEKMYIKLGKQIGIFMTYCLIIRTYYLVGAPRWQSGNTLASHL